MTKAFEIGGPAAQSTLITPIFRAYYEDDLDISDPDVLADAAEQAGIMSKDDVSAPQCVATAVPRSFVFGVDPHSKLNWKSDGC